MHTEERIVVDRPVEEVWAFLTDFFNLPRASGSGMLGMRQTSPGPLGVGSTAQSRMVILGFETRVTTVYTEWDPPHAMGMTTKARPIRSWVSRVTLESTPAGTEVRYIYDWELRPALKLVWPVIGPFFMRRRHAAFQNIKGVIEATPRSEDP